MGRNSTHRIKPEAEQEFMQEDEDPVVEEQPEVPGSAILKGALELEVVNYRRQVSALQAQMFETQQTRERIDKTLETIEQQIRAAIVRIETTERIMGML